MKKKLTVGVFLALAVVLVASIVGVGGADAGKPSREIDIRLLTVGKVADSGYITFDYGWDGWGAWGARVRIHQFVTNTGAHEGIILDSLLPRVPKRTTSFAGAAAISDSAIECGHDYRAQIWLIKKNGSDVRDASTISGGRITYECP